MKTRTLIQDTVDAVVRRAARITWIERSLTCVARPLRNLPLFRGLWWRMRKEVGLRRGGTDSGLRWVRLCSGGGMYVDVADMLGCLYWERQLYEPATTAFMDRHLKEGDVFADIGANHGYFSLIAAGRVGRGGRVASFEANPRLRRILQRSIDRNRWQGRATVADCALSDAEQDITLYLSNNPELSGISSMFPWEGHLTAGNLDKSRSITVTARRFDTWAAQSGLTRLDVVKIDVEGAELLVLKGMTETLTSLKPRHIVCETGLDGPVSQRLALFGYRASPLELHDHGSGWGNILYTR